jgi:dihydroxyacetone kinase phosphotransfer subunit
MISLVLVSHSRPLAQALVELIHQFALSGVKVAIAAGSGPDHQDFGTDATEIAQAIQSVYSPEGVLVLMDMGSAVLSAEMALDFLSEDIRKHILISPAPLVEGAIIAVVQAGVGSDLQTVAQEAEKALIPKIQQLEGK